MKEASGGILPSCYRFFIFSVVSFYFIPSFDNARLVISLPTIADHFSIGTGLASWVLASYFLAFISSLLILGSLADILDM